MSEAEDLRALREDLRAAVREAREALKDLRSERRLWQPLPGQVAERIDRQVETGLAEYRAALDAAIESATAKVTQRFDYLADLLLGEDRQSRRAGRASIPDLLRARVKEGS